MIIIMQLFKNSREASHVKEMLPAQPQSLICFIQK